MENLIQLLEINIRNSSIHICKQCKKLLEKRWKLRNNIEEIDGKLRKLCPTHESETENLSFFSPSKICRNVNVLESETAGGTIHCFYRLCCQ